LCVVGEGFKTGNFQTLKFEHALLNCSFWAGLLTRTVGFEGMCVRVVNISGRRLECQPEPELSFP